MSLFARAKELRQQRADVVAEAGKLLEKAATEKRDMTAEEKTEFEKRHAKGDELKGQIDLVERQIEAERALVAGNHTETPGSEGTTDKAQAEARKAAHNKAYRSWMAYGLDGLTAEERQLIQPLRVEGKEQRALSAITGAAGGYTVPQDFASQIDVATKYYGGILDVADIMTTSEGHDMPYPSMNDTSNVGEQLGENTGAAGEDGNSDPAFNSVTMKAWMWSSKIILIPLQLLQDSAFDVEKLMADKLGERLGRIINTRCTTGAGVVTAQGIVVGAAAGPTTASATAIAWTEMVDLEHSVDRTYRQSARWMFHDSTLAAFKKMVDNYGRPLWLPGVAVGAPDSFMGYPYTVNNDMDEIAASHKTVLFGDLKKYKVRKVGGYGMVAFRERYMNALQVGFLAFMRLDGRMVDAGMHPVKYLAQHA